jgi:hypothetical protein
MKKYLLICLFWAGALNLLAQEPALYKDFYNGVKDINSFVLSDHVNIMQVNTDNENFDVVAVNDQMQVLWKTSCAGFAFTAAKFKDKIIAVASTDHSSITGGNNTYKAYLLDPATGKILIEKVIYTGTDDYLDFVKVITGEGAYFKLCVRQSAFERRMHVALPSLFSIISENKYIRQLNQTQQLEVITLNEKLETINSFKPPVANGTMITWNGNKQGDLFIAWLNGPQIEVYQFPAGSTSPTKQLNASVEIKQDNTVIPSEDFILLPSPTNNNIVYYGLSYTNPNKEAELGVGKLDFSAEKKFFVTEEFNKDHVKALQKGFVPVIKKLDEADLGSRRDLHIKHLAEVDGTLIATVASQTASSSSINSSGSWITEGSTLINGYNADLSTKFQQIMPSGYTIPNKTLPSGFHPLKNKLYVLVNNKTGMATLNGILGCLDVSTGKWDKMEILSKKHIDNSDYASGAVLWFGTSYIVPYLSPRGMMKNKFDITLQLNNY